MPSPTFCFRNEAESIQRGIHSESAEPVLWLRRTISALFFIQLRRCNKDYRWSSTITPAGGVKVKVSAPEAGLVFTCFKVNSLR